MPKVQFENGATVEFDREPSLQDIEEAARQLGIEDPKPKSDVQPAPIPDHSSPGVLTRKASAENDAERFLELARKVRPEGTPDPLLTPDSAINTIGKTDKPLEPIGPNNLMFLPSAHELANAEADLIAPSRKDIEAGKVGVPGIAGRALAESVAELLPQDVATYVGLKGFGKVVEGAAPLIAEGASSAFGKLVDPELQMIRGAIDKSAIKQAGRIRPVVPLKTHEPKPIEINESEFGKDRSPEFYQKKLVQKTGLDEETASQLHIDMDQMRDELKGPVVPGKNDEGVKIATDQYDVTLIRATKDSPEKWVIETKIEDPAKKLAKQLATRDSDPDIKGNINLDKIGSDNAVEVIKKTANIIKDRVDIQTRGKMSNEYLQEFADSVDMSPQRLKELNPGAIFNAEEALAARNLMHESAQKTFEYAKAFKSAKDPIIKAQALKDFGLAFARHQDIQTAVSGLTAEAGRLLQQFKLNSKGFSSKASVIQAMMEESANLSEGALVEMAEKIGSFSGKSEAELANFVAKADKATFEQALIEGFTAMKLTNPYTYLRNATGNTLAILTRIAEKSVSGPIDFLRVNTTNLVRKAVGKPSIPRATYSGEFPAEIYGFGQGIKEGAGKALREFAKVYTGEKPIDPRLAEVQASREAIPGITGRIIRIPYNILSGTDMFFREILKTGAARSAAYRTAYKEGLGGLKLAERTDDLFKKVIAGDYNSVPVAERNTMLSIKESASLVSDEFTFQRELGKFAKGANMMRNNFLGRIIMPFFKTPVNLGKFVVQRAPLISFFSPRNINDVFSKGGAEATEALSRIMVGHTVGAGLVLHALDGKITGAPPKNQSENDALTRLGWQPYSIKVGDKYYSYLGYDPISTQLAVAADLATAYNQRHEELPSETVSKLATSVVRNIGSQPYLQGLSGLLDFLNDPDKTGPRFLSQTLSGMVVPTGVAALTRAKDPIARSPRGIVESIVARTPGLSTTIRPKRNVWGEPIVRDEHPLAPVRVKTIRTDPLEQYLSSHGIKIGFPSKDINDRKLTDDEYDFMLANSGPRLKMRLGLMAREPGFRQLSLPDQIRQVRMAIETEREPFRQQLIVPSELRALGLDPKAVPADKTPVLRALFNMDVYKTLPHDQAKRLAVETLLKNIGGTQ